MALCGVIFKKLMFYKVSSNFVLSKRWKKWAKIISLFWEKHDPHFKEFIVNKALHFLIVILFIFPQ